MVGGIHNISTKKRDVTYNMIARKSLWWQFPWSWKGIVKICEATADLSCSAHRSAGLCEAKFQGLQKSAEHNDGGMPFEL